MAWPTQSEIENALIGMGFSQSTFVGDVETVTCTIPQTVNNAMITAQAVAALEAATGFKPLIADAASALKFDPPNFGTRLFPRKALCDVDAIKMNGETLVEGTDYWVYSDSDQVAYIEFRRLPAYQIPQCIEITGYWGRYKAVPDILKGIALRLACALCVIQFREGLKAQPVRWNEGDVSESYGELMLKGAGEDLRDSALKEAQGVCFNAGCFF